MRVDTLHFLLLVERLLGLSVSGLRWRTIQRRGPPGAAALPPITPLRYTEDYSAAPPSLKHIPLGHGGDSYLSLGIELRLRYESYQDNQWGQGPQDSGGYLWARVMPYADLHIGEGFRAFGQLIAAFEWWDDAGIRPPDEDRLDVLQAFFEVQIPIGQGETLTVRPGRQIMRYGSERLLGTRYRANVPLPFDAALGAFDTRPVARRRVLRAGPSRSTAASGTIRPTRRRRCGPFTRHRLLPSIGKGAGIDAYYIGYSDEGARFAQGPGEELRHSLGVRLFGEKHHFDWDVEACYQFGRYEMSGGDGVISAFSVKSNIGYTFDRPLRPRLGLKVNVISGDDDPGDPDLQTFNSLFPQRKYFGEMGLLGPYNLIDVHPSLRLQLTKKTTVDLASVLYWRYSTNDGIYNTGGNVVRPGFNSDARYRRDAIGSGLTYKFSRELEVSATYELFLPGPFIEDSGPDEVVHFVGIELLLRF